MPTTTTIVAHAIAFCFFYGTISNGFVGVSFQTRRESSVGEHYKQKGVEFSMYAHSVPDEALMVPVVHTATVDYSAANEYIRAHYDVQSRYFDNVIGGSSVEYFHDGRVLQSHYDDDRKMLNDNGLAIVKCSTAQEPKWSELKDIQNSYLPELERIIHKLFPSKLLSYCFWNPMIRGESYEISREGGSHNIETPTANIASMVHIDTDVGAYESIHDFLDIVEKNKVQTSTSETKLHQNSIQDVADDIVHGKKRFVIVNFWKNIGDTPVSKAPLAILSTRYNKQHSAFPNSHPNMEESKWYVFPNATRDEVIVFYQYDRNLKQPSDLWHCAISPENNETKLQDFQESPPRKSFDIRALIVLDEFVPEEFDRFSSDRTRPVLTFEESGCFCDEQAANRNEE